MDETTFWSIIETANYTEPDAQLAALEQALSALSKDELIQFERAYHNALNAAYRWDLWAAAYIILGGCSDDGFDYFRDALIAKGYGVYSKALENPESLVGEFVPYEAEFEEFRYVMYEVMEKQYGDEFPQPDIPSPTDPAGKAWDEDTVDTMFPALSAWMNEGENQYVDNADTSPNTDKTKSFWHKLFGK